MQRTADILEEVYRERVRVVHEEGFGPSHDAEYAPGVLTKAARCLSQLAFLNRATKVMDPPPEWPWEREWWEKNFKTPTRRILIKVIGLLVAEVEKLDREEG